MLLYTHVCRRTVSGLSTQPGLKGVRKPNTHAKDKLPPLHVGDRRTANGKTSLKTINLGWWWWWGNNLEHFDVKTRLSKTKFLDTKNILLQF